MIAQHELELFDTDIESVLKTEEGIRTATQIGRDFFKPEQISSILTSDQDDTLIEHSRNDDTVAMTDNELQELGLETTQDSSTSLDLGQITTISTSEPILSVEENQERIVRELREHFFTVFNKGENVFSYCQTPEEKLCVLMTLGKVKVSGAGKYVVFTPKILKQLVQSISYNGTAGYVNEALNQLSTEDFKVENQNIGAASN